jgi:glutathione S-transferase
MKTGYDHLLTTDTDPNVPLLCSFEGCPFAQTARITLVHKNIKFRRAEVEVFNKSATAMAEKPDWFLKLSPRGRVPVLIHHGRVLYESACIDQYLDEVFTGPKMMPEDAGLRALVRVWLSQASATLPRLWYRNLVAQGNDIAETRDRLDEFFQEFEEGLEDLGGDGPWLIGDQPTLADFFFAPFYERINALQGEFGKYSLPDSQRLPRVRRHIDTVLAHPSFLATRLEPDWLCKLYRPFAQAEDWISAENNRAVRDIVD